MVLRARRDFRAQTVKRESRDHLARKDRRDRRGRREHPALLAQWDRWARQVHRGRMASPVDKVRPVPPARRD